MSREINKEVTIPDFSLFQSPNITDTGSQGLCFSLFYTVDGLSADSLQVILVDSKSGYNRTLAYYNDVTESEWRKSEIAYTYAAIHKVRMIKLLQMKTFFFVLTLLFLSIDRIESKC